MMSDAEDISEQHPAQFSSEVWENIQKICAAHGYSELEVRGRAQFFAFPKYETQKVPVDTEGELEAYLAKVVWEDFKSFLYLVPYVVRDLFSALFQVLWIHFDDSENSFN